MQTIGGSVETSGFLEVDQAAVDEREGANVKQPRTTSLLCSDGGETVTSEKLFYWLHACVCADIVLVAQITMITNV